MPILELVILVCSVLHWSLLSPKWLRVIIMDVVCCVWYLFEHEKPLEVSHDFFFFFWNIWIFVYFSWCFVFAAPSSANNGYIYAKIFGGFDKIRSSVCITWLDSLKLIFIFVIYVHNIFVNFLDMWSCHHIQASKCYSYHSRASRESSLQRHQVRLTLCSVKASFFASVSDSSLYSSVFLHAVQQQVQEFLLSLWWGAVYILS